jgi:sirohydrochlorin ferrochelatase
MEAEKSKAKQDTRKCHCDGKCESCTYRHKKATRRTGQTAPLQTVTSVLAILLITAGCAIGVDKNSGDSTGKPGLLIIAHGSPSPQWNKPVIAQEQKVMDIFGTNNPYAKVKVVFMEFAEPNVADGIAQMELAGCDRIVAVPMLIAPSSHSHWDIPALLGIYSNPEIEKNLLEEGTQLLRSKVPITLTTTLSESDVIDKIMLKRVRELSRDPNNEAIVLLAHGSEATPAAWERMMKRTVTNICGRTGISYGDWAFVGVGREYRQAIAAIREAAKHRDHVIVVGAYLSLGAKKVHQRWMARFEEKSSIPGFENPLENLSIRTSSEGLLPDEAVAQWIVDTARDEIARHP